MAKRSRMWEQYGFAWGAYRDKGGRSYQEDGYAVEADFNSVIKDLSVLPEKKRAMFALFDGHGGVKCMEFCRANVAGFLAQALVECRGESEAAMALCFKLCEEAWFKGITAGRSLAEVTERSGCTMVVCLIEDDQLTCGNVGDSRAVIYDTRTSKECVSLTDDHKPDRESERKRIEGVGAAAVQKTRTTEGCRPLCIKPRVVPEGPFRVQPGGLAVARSIGDAACKLAELGAIPGAVSAEAEIKSCTLNDSAQFLVLASDGVWDTYPDSVKLLRCISSSVEQTHEEIHAGYHAKDKKDRCRNALLANDLAECVVATAIQKGRAKGVSNPDNTTCVMVWLPFHMQKKWFNLSERRANGKPKKG